MISIKTNKYIFIILTFGSFIFAMSTTITAVMLPSIMDAFLISAGDAQWLSSGATLVSGITIPIAAYFIKRSSSKKYFLLVTTIFSAGTLLSAVSPNYSLLLIGRLIQAVGSGMIMPFSQVVVLNIYPKNKHGTVMGIFTMAGSTAPIVAPIFAGLVTDNYGFQSVFFFLLIAGLIILLLGFIFMKNVTETYREQFPYIPIVFSSFGFLGLLVGLGNMSMNSIFRIQTGGFMMFGLFCLVLFVRMQLRSPEPHLNLRIFKNLDFRTSVIIIMLVSLAVMGNAMFMPLYAQSILGYSATVYALVTLPGSIVLSVSTMLSGKLYDMKGPKLLLISGAFFLPVGSIIGIFFNYTSGLLHLGFVSFLHAFTAGTLNTSATILGLSILKGKDRVDGSSILNTLRQISLAIASAASIVIYSMVKNTFGEIPGVKAVYASFLIYGLLVLYFILMFFRKK